MICVNIDFKAIDQTKLNRKGGKSYGDLILFDKPRDGSDGFVVQGQSKEDREAGNKMPIIGNWKYIGQKPQGGQQGTRPPQRAFPPEGDIDF